MLKLQPAMLGYSRAWDKRERMIENSKSQRIPYAIVRRLHNWADLDEIEADPKILWLTRCVQDYYGIPVMPDLGDLIGEPNAEAKQAEVENEFHTIQPVPGSVPTELNSIYKTTRGKIGFYNTDQSPEQIRSHYQAELSRHGWKYIGTKKVEAFQRFSGDTQTLFCKGDTSAILFVTGQDQERLGYTYSVALNWGSSSGFVWGAIDCKE
jgi:hypothetical protein